MSMQLVDGPLVGEKRRFAVSRDLKAECESTGGRRVAVAGIKRDK